MKWVDRIYGTSNNTKVTPQHIKVVVTSYKVTGTTHQ